MYEPSRGAPKLGPRHRNPATSIVSGHYPLQLTNVRYREVGTSSRASWMDADPTDCIRPDLAESGMAAFDGASAKADAGFMEIDKGCDTVE